MKIPVTKPYLPPNEQYFQLLNQIWKNNWLTNNGPFVKKLEDELSAYLHSRQLNFVSNGTMALQLAIRALELSGEIITTPFSYIATTSSVVWEGCQPIFVDIDRETFNIDPDLIEDSITERTSAILATHVFGNPCNIDKIDKLAKKYNLKVIYDAAHSFGVSYKGKSIFDYGHISTASFHATKLYHTIEGGAVFCHEMNLHEKISRMRNFGHNGPYNFSELGINGKNSEFHAAMGLVNLKYIDRLIAERLRIADIYYSRLSSYVTYQKAEPDSVANGAYFPILFEHESQCIKAEKYLSNNGIGSRRYFYPLLSTLDYVNDKHLPVADYISRRILCLPMYNGLKENQIEQICIKLLND